MRLTQTVQVGVLTAGGMIILVILGAIWGQTAKQSEMIKNYVYLSAKAYFESIVLTRRWNAQYGGVYVEKKAGAHSNPYLKDPDITSTDGRIFTMKNPALMTREISVLAKKLGTYQYHITSLNLLNPENQPDLWEKTALESFQKGTLERAEIVSSAERKVYRYMAPLIYEDGCAKCHAQQGYKKGDVRGGISVTLPYDEIELALQGNQKRMMTLAVIIAAILAATFYLLIWQLMRRLNQAVSLLDNEKKKLEESQAALTAERNKLDEIISSIDADLLLLNEDMKIIWTNKKLRERKTFSDVPLIGEDCNKAYCNLDHVPDNCPAKQSFNTGESVRQEHSITHPDGTVRIYAFTCSPVKDKDGQVTHVLELVQDITDKTAQDKLMATQMQELTRVQEDMLEINRMLHNKNKELERFNKLFVDREFKIKELKDKLKSYESEKDI